MERRDDNGASAATPPVLSYAPPAPRDIAGAIRRVARILLIVLAGAAVGALLGRLTMKPMHTATGLYEVSVKAPSPAAHAQLMAAHVAWVTRPAFLASVMNRIPARRREATLFRSPEHFSEHLTVSHLRGSELIQISVINEDQNAANVAVKELTKAVQEAAEAGPTGAVVDVHIIAASGPEPVPIRDRSPVVAGGIAGAVVAWLLWLYWHRRHQRAVLSRLPAV